MKGIFGSLFDFNHNGKLDSAEQAMEFAAFATMMDHATEESEEEKLETELEMAGLDPDKFDF